MRIDSIILEHSLLGGKLYLIQELLRTVNFHPCLPQASLLAAHVLDLNVSLLVGIITLVEKVTNVFAIDLKCADFDHYHFIEVPAVAVNF